MKFEVGDKVIILGQWVGTIVNINSYREPSMIYAIDVDGYEEDVIFMGEDEIELHE